MGGGVAVLTLINPHFLISRMIKFEACNVSMYVEALRLLSNTRIETAFDCDPNSSIYLEAKFSDCSSSTEGGQRH